MKILLVEDDMRVSSLIQRGLETEGFVLTLAYDGLSAQKLAQSQEFDLVITDVILPQQDGISLCKALRALFPQLPILMLTALGTTDDKVEGFDAGADDYLVKPFEMRELLARIRVLLKRAGTRPQGSTRLQLADLEMNLDAKSVARGSQPIDLTPKEFKLLAYMLQNAGRVLSRSEIAEKVWDTHFDTGTNFIDVYINYLRKKIDKPFDKKLIHTKAGMGFVLKEEA
ncbi:response regulator transcription factor [Eisenibacter elegans]|jgi:DNA-binding response OmpR family regulator|uniref:response regulator transcription factor n=1 Tax=Eisenibacter elegans TaxID=997 RepID=UPI0004030F31|nr:response regulator transcription factor [Eisenibacter elegans]